MPMDVQMLGQRSPKAKLRAAIKQRFGGACAYCGCTPRVLTLDHIVARSQGGRDVKSNLAAVCRRCNRSKGSRPLWAWWQNSAVWSEERARRLAETVLVCRVRFGVPSERAANRDRNARS